MSKEDLAALISLIALLSSGESTVGLPHVHILDGMVDEADGHRHQYAGVTGVAIGSGEGHTHSLAGLTDITGRHLHRLDGVTGPALYREDGGHTHQYNGRTLESEGHTHSFTGETSKEHPA